MYPSKVNKRTKLKLLPLIYNQMVIKDNCYYKNEAICSPGNYR